MNCELCGGIHFGSGPRCPYRCELCGHNIGPCLETSCPRDRRWKTEQASIQIDRGVESKQGATMERNRLEQHKATLDAIASTCEVLGRLDTMPPDTEAALARQLSTMAAIVGELIEAKLGVGAHAAAVDRMMNRPNDEARREEPRMNLAGPGSAVERSGPRVIKTGSIGEERASWCRKNVRDKGGIKTGLPCGLPIGHEGDCVPVAPDARD